MNSLFTKLSLVLLLMLLTLGLAILWLANRSSQEYILEFTQKLNRPIAMYMADNIDWLDEGKLSPAALDELMPHIMMINPSVDVFLLDNQGRVVAGSNALQAIADEVPQRYATTTQTVDLQPITQFLSEEPVFPLFGTHPGKPDVESIFSVWPVEQAKRIAQSSATGDGPAGYVYVVLRSDKHETLLASVQGSYSIRDMLITLAGVLTLTLFGGVLVFFMLTKRLRHLASEARHYSMNDPLPLAGGGVSAQQLTAKTSQSALFHSRTAHSTEGAVGGDEIDLLKSTYDTMTQELMDRYRQLEHSDVSRREFIASISHDLRTPLTSLQNYLETVLAKWTSINNERRYTFIASAHRQSLRLQHLITQLFEIAKLNSPDLQLQPERFSMLELAYDCVQDVELHAGKSGITININAQHAERVDFDVLADIALIQRVLENLLTNAIRHTPKNGRVQIDLTTINKYELCVKIVDTGCGLSAKQVNEFDRTGVITQTGGKSLHGEKHSGSTGLGMSIVQRILGLHGSRLVLSDNRSCKAVRDTGTGVGFEFQLPNVSHSNVDAKRTKQSTHYYGVDEVKSSAALS